jgi:hypothetical protein
MHLHEIVKIDAGAFSAVHCFVTLCMGAADLKFLHRLPQAFKDSKSNRGTGIIALVTELVLELVLDLVVPFCFPKFVSEGAAIYYEFRKQGTRL